MEVDIPTHFAGQRVLGKEIEKPFDGRGEERSVQAGDAKVG